MYLRESQFRSSPLEGGPTQQTPLQAGVSDPVFQTLLMLPVIQKQKQLSQFDSGNAPFGANGASW
jgi:hypothetical protein